MTQQAAARGTYDERRGADETRSIDSRDSPPVDARNGVGSRSKASSVAPERRPDHPYLPGYYLG